MHPTPYKLESQECCVGARVMPGIRFLDELWDYLIDFVEAAGSRRVMIETGRPTRPGVAE
jgi:hypothetical protein